MSSVEQIFLRLKRRPRWLLVFFLLNIVLAGVEIGMDPIVREAAFGRLPAGATEQDKVALSEMLDRQVPLRLAFLPVRNVLGWGLFALCLYFTALAFRPLTPVRFVQIFALEIWAETALLLGDMATLIREWLTPSGATQFRNVPPLSLLDVVPTVGSFELDTMLGRLNLFSGSYLVLLTMGLAAVCGFQTKKALLVVLSVWGVSLVLNAGALAALRDLLHLAP